MQDDSIGGRIEKLREFLGLERKEFAEKIGKTEPTISRAERNKTKPSEGFLRALTAYCSVNPDWILTGEGKMFLTVEDYIENGIDLFGDQKMSEGLVRIFKNPLFEKFHSLVKAENLVDSDIDEELKKCFRYVIDIWNQGDEKTRHWLERQLEMAFRDLK